MLGSGIIGFVFLEPSHALSQVAELALVAELAFWNANPCVLLLWVMLYITKTLKTNKDSSLQRTARQGAVFDRFSVLIFLVYSYPKLPNLSVLI